MSVAYILDFPDASLEHYDAAQERMQLAGRLPEGALSHVAGPGPGGGLRVVDVWESDAAFERFSTERIGPVTSELGMGPPRVVRVEVAEMRDSGLPRARMTIFHVVYVPLDADGFREMDREVVGGPDVVPEGLVFHVNGPGPSGGWIVADGWVSREARDRFMAERVGPAALRRGMTPSEIEDLEVHNTLEPAATKARA